MKQRALVTICLAALFAIAAHAQLATTTSLVGTVTDSSGKLIPGAKVTATETRTLDKYNTITNGQGNYTFEFVRVGVYSITVEQAGFQKLTKTGIIVDVDQTVRTDIALSVGAVSQSVTVEAIVSAIKTDDASISEILGTRNVAELPLNGRDAMSLATSTPGVLPGIKSSATGTPPGEDFNGAGTREIQNEMSLDGISIMNNLITTTPVQPMIEAIQEVEIQTGTYSAQYGSYLGVHINMITKSGTNQIHGSLFEFLNNQVLNARNYFTLPTPASSAPEPVRRRGRRPRRDPETL
jgi:Carboxypeptidase regulatory-like domain/TonB-dependent Receptor Plug Domain